LALQLDRLNFGHEPAAVVGQECGHNGEHNTLKPPMFRKPLRSGAEGAYSDVAGDWRTAESCETMAGDERHTVISRMAYASILLRQNEMTEITLPH